MMRQTSAATTARTSAIACGRGHARCVYLLWHAYDLDEEDEVKRLGVYSSEAKARERLEQARLLPGFAEHPENFRIDPYVLDKDEWTAGFVTARQR